MEQRSLSDLVSFSMDSFRNPQKLKEITTQNKERLPKELPKEVHVPDEQELEQIAQWMTDYKKQFPHASKRQVRLAAQVHFNIRVFRKPYKTDKNGTV